LKKPPHITNANKHTSTLHGTPCVKTRQDKTRKERKEKKREAAPQRTPQNHREDLRTEENCSPKLEFGGPSLYAPKVRSTRKESSWEKAKAIARRLLGWVRNLAFWVVAKFCAITQVGCLKVARQSEKP